MQRQKVAEVHEPSLPRQLKVPPRFEVGESSGHFASSVENHYTDPFSLLLYILILSTSALTVVSTNQATNYIVNWKQSC